MLEALWRLKSVLASGLPFFFAAVSLHAAGMTPLGTMRSQGGVYLGGRAARVDTVVFGGDHLRTEEGQATISFHRGELLVLEKHTGANFSDFPGGFSVRLETGELALYVPSQHTVRVETDGLAISPSGTFPCLAQIAFATDGSATVAVHRGKVSIANLRQEPIVVNAGQVLTVSPRLTRAQDQSVGTAAHGKMSLPEKLRTFHIGSLSHTASVAVAGVGIGAAVAGAVVSITEQAASPSSP